MAGSTHGGLARDDRRRSKSRSQDHDSDAERRRRRHRREHGDRRSRRTDEDRKERREGDEMDVKRRRSRSPRSPRESSRRHHRDREHRDAKHRSRRERSPRAREEDGDREMQVTRKAKGPLPSQEASFSVMRSAGAEGALVRHDGAAVPEKQKPNFAPTGLLAAATKTVEMADGTSVVLKYHEPSEARKPPAKEAWKLFVFKGEEIVDTIGLGLRSCWLIGREVAVVDLAAEHPSVSKQHAVIQFRYVERRNEFGDKIGRVRPYLIDLESANGTVLNGERVEERRYVELRDRDLIRFGNSTREYVVMLPPKD